MEEEEGSEEESEDSSEEESRTSLDVTSVLWRKQSREKLLRALLDDKLNDILVMDETIVMLNSKLNKEPIELSHKQNTRLRVQAMAVMTFYEVMDELHSSSEKASTLQSDEDEEEEVKSKSTLECASIAAEKCLGMTTGKTIYSWHLQFRKNDRKFPPDARGRNNNVGTFLDRNEDLNIIFKNWLKQNLKNLSSQKAQNFINWVLLPNHYYCNDTHANEEPEEAEGEGSGSEKRRNSGRERRYNIDGVEVDASRDLEVTVCVW